MDKPEKLIVELVVNNPVATGRLRGYNDAIDDYEAWLKEAMSVENISRVIEMFTMQEMYGNELAKAIHKLIGK